MESEKDYEIFEELLKRYNEGDQNAVEEIISSVEPILRKRCRYYFEFENEELIQAGRDRCLVLIDRYDSRFVGVKFLGYLSRMISCFYWELKNSQLKVKAE